ncbi:MAG: glycosyl hydrolase, partial [Limnochordia bacterium]
MERKEFAAPGRQYRAVHLWMLNDALHPAEIRRQIASLAEAGCGSIIARTYMGLRTEYLSPEYMACMEAALNAALEQSLDVFLQAGYMPNGVPGMTPAAQGSGVAAIPRDAALPPGATVLAATSDFAFTVQPFAHAVDLLSAEAVQAYIDLAYERAWQPLRRYFGRPIRSVWVDEPSFRPPLIPWSPRLPERFVATWGYDLLPHLPSLFQRIGDYQAVRHHYWRIVVEMLKEAYFAKVAQWCAENGLEFSGHLMGEDTLVDQIALTGACMPLYEYMHLPGIDHLSSSLCWTHGAQGGEGGLPFILNPKQCTSVAAQLGRPRALAEMYGVSTQGLTFIDQKRIAEYLAVQGINVRCLHASFYSMRGRRKRLHAPNLHYQQPWWEANAEAAAYFARLSYLLRQGKEAAHVLVLHPVESAYICYDPLLYRQALHARKPMPDIEQMNRHVVELGLCLNSAGIGWHFGDESLLARHARVLDDGSMQVGEMRYRAVILPEVKTLRSTTAALLCRLAEAGGAILTTAGVPALIDGRPKPEVTEALAACARPVEMNRVALTEALIADGAITIDERDDAVWVQRRRTAAGEMLFLVNTSPEKAAPVRLTAPAFCALTEWRLPDGQTQDCGSTAQFTLAPLASRVFTARQAT